jgi:hypothetical protein
MFTVKLKKGSSTKIVGADRVFIRPCGKDSTIIAPTDAKSSLIQAIDCISGLHGIETYYISHQPLTQENSFEVGEEFDAAYIENANGQTTERVCANN